MIIFKPLVWLIRLPIALIRFIVKISFRLARFFLSWFQWGGRMTFNNIASYWVHMLTHHPDIVRYVRDLLNAIRTSRAFNEQGHRQEVRRTPA